MDDQLTVVFMNFVAVHSPQETAAKAQVQLYEIVGANAQRFDLHAWPLFNVSLPET